MSAERATLAQWEFEEARMWLVNAPAGAQRVYHEGNLAVDRERDPTAESVACLMKWAAQRSLTLLTQTRLEPTVAEKIGDSWHIKSSGAFAYTATRSAVACGVVPTAVPPRDTLVESRQ